MKRRTGKKAKTKGGKKVSGKKTAARKPRPVTIEVDAALKAMWLRAEKALEGAKNEGAHAFDAKYEAIGDIIEHDPPLYLAGGMATMSEFFRRYLPGEDERTIQRNVRVARYASPHEEELYGTSAIDAAIAYLEAKLGKPARGRIPVDFAKLRIATREGTVPFAAAQVQDIQDATRELLRAGGHAKRADRSPVVAAITRCLPRGAKSVTVHYAHGHVSLGRIPIASYQATLRALAKAELPSD